MAEGGGAAPPFLASSTTMDAGEWEAGRVARIASLAQGLTRVRRASATTTTLTKHKMRESNIYEYTVRGAASTIVCRSKRSPKIAMRDDAMRWEEKRFEQGSSYFDRKKGGGPLSCPLQQHSSPSRWKYPISPTFSQGRMETCTRQCRL